MTATLRPIERLASRSSADLRLVLRRPESVHALTEEHRRWLEAALLGDPRATLDDVLAEVESEEVQLWEVRSGRAVLALLTTRMVEYPRCLAMRIEQIGGHSMRSWLPLLPELEEHARNLGCRFLETASGRIGWWRLLPGYALRGAPLVKEL